MATYLKQQPSKKEEIRRLVVAELLGKFEKLKYPAGDLSREIDFAVSKEVELEWEKGSDLHLRRSDTARGNQTSSNHANWRNPNLFLHFLPYRKQQPLSVVLF